MTRSSPNCWRSRPSTRNSTTSRSWTRRRPATHAGAGRLGGRAGGAVDVALGGLAHVRRSDARGPGRTDEPAPRRPQAGGDDDRRTRAAGAHDVVALGITTEGVKI